MKKLSFISVVILIVLSLALPAFPADYEIDIDQDEAYETGGSVNLCGRTDVPIDVRVRNYSCVPHDFFFGVQTYITVDTSVVQVNECQPDVAGGCDPTMSECTQLEDNVYFLICANFTFCGSDYTGGLRLHELQ